MKQNDSKEAPQKGERLQKILARGGIAVRRRTRAWTAATGWSWVTRGSHAGHIVPGAGGARRTEADGVALVPLETLPDRDRITGFAIDPPWRKAVYRDPEATAT